MRKNKIIIRINKPLTDVYEFTINPKNTPLWVDSVVTEKTNEWPIKIGTKYKNKTKDGVWSEYIVNALEPNKLFELVSEDGNYHVRYNYNQIENDVSGLEYFEWVNNGELKDPFDKTILNKLKQVLES